MPVRGDALMNPTNAVPALRTARRSSGIRTDIQGLRALAVVVVVLDHMIKWPTGGYVGVDVFFVISGFLITGLLLREHERTGRICFSDFYRRRLRRITPVAVLVLVVTLVAMFLVYGMGRTRTVLVDGVYSLFFAANWHFAAIGTDYMQANGPVSPLQHYWSLAVEEQFYLIWPVIILLVLGIAATRLELGRIRALRLLRLTLVILSAASFVYACWQSRAEPTWAYFSTLSRGWELGVGALVATLTARLSRIPASVRPILARIGLISILGSVILLNSQSVFPAPGGAVPVLGTALLIAAYSGARRAPRYGFLAMRPMQYLGTISYSLYLWHFPVVIISATLFPQPQNVLTVLVQLALMLLLSTASFRLIEDPIRKSSWLNVTERGGNRRAAGRPSGMGWSKIALAGLGPACLALLVSFVLTGLSAGVPADADEAGHFVALEIDPALRAGQIKSALEAPAWPTLTPAIDDLGPKAWVPEWREDLCQDVWEADLSRCVYGEKQAPKTAVLVGDSIAISYMPGLKRALAESGWKIQSLTLQQCPAINISVLKDGGSEGKAPDYPECDRHHKWVKDYLTRTEPDLVIVSSVQESVLRLASRVQGPDAVRAWSRATTETLTEFGSLADKVVLLTSPPKGAVLQWCATTASTPEDCVTARTAEHLEMQRAEVAAAPRELSNVSVLDTTSWFCDADNNCPAFVGDTPMFADGGHLTERYSKMLGPVLRSGLLGR